MISNFYKRCPFSFYENGNFRYCDPECMAFAYSERQNTYYCARLKNTFLIKEANPDEKQED